MTTREEIEQEWQELIHDALASDGAITDKDVKDAVERHKEKIERLYDNYFYWLYNTPQW